MPRSNPIYRNRRGASGKTDKGAYAELRILVNPRTIANADLELLAGFRYLEDIEDRLSLWMDLAGGSELLPLCLDQLLIHRHNGVRRSKRKQRTRSAMPTYSAKIEARMLRKRSETKQGGNREQGRQCRPTGKDRSNDIEENGC